MANQSLVSVGGITCPVSLEQGQVWIHLPFYVDPQQLSSQLLREGYALAHAPDSPDTQGWGAEFSPNGYYPYYLFSDPEEPGRSVFAFYPNPEDSLNRGSLEPVAVALGERSRQTVERWVPVLAHLGGRPGGGEAE